MSYVHPAWLGHQRQRFERHDAHRFMKPEPVQRKSYAERMLEARRAAEEERVAAEHDAFEREVLALRREWAESNSISQSGSCGSRRFIRPMKIRRSKPMRIPLIIRTASRACRRGVLTAGSGRAKEEVLAPT